MNQAYQAVREFHKAFGHPVADQPQPMLPSRALKRVKWMHEEIDEFLHSTLESKDTVDTITGQADAMIDLIYFALGTLVEMGVKPEELFNIVQRANMAKLHADGKAHYNADGKVVKPAGWQPPEPQLRAEIVVQMADAELEEDLRKGRSQP